MGIVLQGDFGEKGRVGSRLDEVTAQFMEWACPELDAAHIGDEQRTVYEAIYRDLALRLATAYSDLRVSVRLPDYLSAVDVANLREDVRRAMTELYLGLSGVAVIALRRALLTAVNTKSSAPVP